jgi:hypothetical protein
VAVDEAADRVAAEGSAAGAGEQWVAGCPGALGEPGLQQAAGLSAQWCDPFLASFPVAAHVRPGAEVDSAADQAGELGDPYPVSSASSNSV